MTLEILKLSKDPKYNVMLEGIGSQMPHIANAIMVNDTFSVGGNSQYESPYINLMQAAVQKVLGDTAANYIAHGTKAAGVMATKKEMTRMAWIGTDLPEFQLTLLFTDVEYHDPREPAKQIIASVYPIEKGLVLTAPGDYSVIDAPDKGVYHIAIGQWFRAQNQILRNAVGQFSRQVNRDGYPKYVTVDILFHPFQMISNRELQDYFL